MTELQTRISADIRRLESTDDPRFGGVHLHTPSGIQIAAIWRTPGLIGDTLASAKAAAAQLMDKLVREHEGKDIDRINWPSVVAAIQKHMQDWNELRRAQLYADYPIVPTTKQ